MMSWLDKILSRSSASSDGVSSSDSEAIRRIVDGLEALEPERASYVASFAYILGRVAHADREISRVETDAMERIVSRLGRLPEHQAILAVQIAKSQNRLFGGTENFLVTREFKQMADEAQKRELLDCLFAVSAADDSISSVEEGQIRQIASELGLSHADYVQARLSYSDKRQVLEPFRRD
ncbi:MAG: TerB family tellurite resistance protein [Acidobacteriota bacterium]|nr:TerB family tellurite resistance protein [Acidobacteriota bacterium]